MKEINFQCDDILIKTEILRLSLNLLHKEFSSSELMNQLINEAIELAKKYSDDDVRKMINAVLDKMIKE